MAEETKVQATDVEEVYYIKPVEKPDAKRSHRDGGEWKKVSKQDFGKFDGPAVFGTKDEIKTKIGELEEVPPECVTEEYDAKSFSVSLTSSEHLPHFLEWTKRNDKPIRMHFGNWNFSRLKAHSPKEVYRENSYHGCSEFAIGTEWVVSGSELRYDPEKAAEIIEKHKKLPPEKKIVRSKLKIRNMLGPLFRIIDKKIDAMTHFSQQYPGNRSWYHRSLLRVSSPSTIEQYVWALPVYAAFYTQLTRKKDYRTLEWKKTVASILPLLKDPMVTKDFRKFIVREHCNR